MEKNFDFLLKFFVYVQYYLPILTMFLDEWNNILVIYLDFRYLYCVGDFFTMFIIDSTYHITIGQGMS